MINTVISKNVRTDGVTDCTDYLTDYGANLLRRVSAQIDGVRAKSKAANVVNNKLSAVTLQLLV